MKNQIELVAGGIAGLLTALALGAGLVACAAQSGSDPSEPSAETEVAPVPSPRLAPELTATHREAARPDAAPAPAPIVEAPDPYAPRLASSGAIRVSRLIVSSGVADHEPTGAADEFEIGAQRQIYAFVDAQNATGEDVALRVTFEPESGESTGHVSLEVPAGARRWRTWATTRNAVRAGRWRAVVRAPDGHELASRAFDVVR